MRVYIAKRDKCKYGYINIHPFPHPLSSSQRASTKHHKNILLLWRRRRQFPCLRLRTGRADNDLGDIFIHRTVFVLPFIGSISCTPSLLWYCVRTR